MQKDWKEKAREWVLAFMMKAARQIRPYNEAAAGLVASWALSLLGTLGLLSYLDENPQEMEHTGTLRALAFVLAEDLREMKESPMVAEALERFSLLDGLEGDMLRRACNTLIDEVEGLPGARLLTEVRNRLAGRWNPELFEQVEPIEKLLRRLDLPIPGGAAETAQSPFAEPVTHFALEKDVKTACGVAIVGGAQGAHGSVAAGGKVVVWSAVVFDVDASGESKLCVDCPDCLSEIGKKTQAMMAQDLAGGGASQAGEEPGQQVSLEGVFIREADSRDIPNLYALQTECFLPELWDSFNELTRLVLKETVLVACDNDYDGICGAVVGLVRPEGLHVYSVEVAPLYRKRGLGTKLVSAILDKGPPASPATACAATDEGSYLLAKFFPLVSVVSEPPAWALPPSSSAPNEPASPTHYVFHGTHETLCGKEVPPKNSGLDRITDATMQDERELVWTSKFYNDWGGRNVDCQACLDKLAELTPQGAAPCAE